MTANLVDRASVTVPLLGRGESVPLIAVDPALREKITAALVAFRDAILNRNQASWRAGLSDTGLCTDSREFPASLC